MSSSINGFAPIDNTRPAPSGRSVYRLSDAPEPAAADSVELSSDVMNLRGVDGTIRLDKVLQVRHELATGRLFTPETWDRAFNRAFDSIVAGR